jgi:uncharacterized protein
MKGFIALIGGILFALGLGLSGMTQPKVVKGFLDIFGEWDWRLLGVMIGAIGIHAITYRLIMRRPSPILDTQFQLPTKRELDLRLLLGAMLFGIGWGWAGICPGPGLVALVSGKMGFIYFVGSMLVGMKLFQVSESLIGRKS